MITGTGGSAVSAGADFLAGEASVTALRRSLPAKQNGLFPPFEALIRVKGRSALPRDATIVIWRPPPRREVTQWVRQPAILKLAVAP